MTYEEAVRYLDSFVNYEHQRDAKAMQEIQLSRMRRLCQRLGDPQRRFRSVLVAGTNGKGSICAMLYSMLRESSLRVGLYTSPHVEHVRERIRVWTSGGSTAQRLHADDWIEETEVVTLIQQLQPVLEQMRQEHPSAAPTYFEVLTALAFVYFQRRQVEVAVLEVGLGGRLDATNVVEPAISIIAPIDVDHSEILGTALARIAKEKAGIIRSHQTLITASQHPEVMEVLRAVCEAEGVPLVVYGQDLTAAIQHQDLDGLQVSLTGLRGIYESVEIPLLGRHQAQNAALAVGALEALSATGIPSSLVERGLARVEWPGRQEIVHDAPLVLMDGAHNPRAAQALRETLEELCPERRIHLLVGMSADKAVEAFGERFTGLVVGATCTKSRHPRALDPVTLAKRLSASCPDVHVISDAADAYTYLLNALSANEVLVVTGSLFLVGELRVALQQSHVHARRGRAQAVGS